MEDLRDLVGKLKSVTNDDIKNGVLNLNLDISEEKFNVAFSGYGATKLLASMDIASLQPTAYKMPNDALETIRSTAVITLRGYVAFVYMRSDVLEKGLDTVSPDSALASFKTFFRAGSIQSSSDTIAQHVRNAFAHGSFIIKGDSIGFSDRNWSLSMSINVFMDLCNELYRFYCCAYEAFKNL